MLSIRVWVFELCYRCGFASTQAKEKAEDGSNESNAETSSDSGDSDEEEGPESRESDSMGTTLELGPRSVEESDNGSTESDSDDESCDVDMKKADNEPFRCQREGGDSWGLCYQDFNHLERMETTVVPVEILYSWWVDGEVSKDEYLGTFTAMDIQRPGC